MNQPGMMTQGGMAPPPGGMQHAPPGQYVQQPQVSVLDQCTQVDVGIVF